VVTAISKLYEEVTDEGVFNRSSRGTGFEVLLGHVGLIARAINEDLVPGLRFIGLVAFPLDLESIPILISLARVVVTDHNATIAVTQVVHDLSHAKEYIRCYRHHSILSVGPGLESDPE